MKKNIEKTINTVNQIILGKDSQVRLALTCLFASGHLLIEDLPGMGKTALSHALAQVLGLKYSRVQFTSDLLPSDILGVAIFDKNSGQFEFHPGPVFAQLVLADEINRATPKTQSALLEAMEENQVTIEGETRPLPQPFFVIATQNPSSQTGTYLLPESQLDRFLMRIELGYPDAESEKEILLGKDRRSLLQQIKPQLSHQQLLEIQNKIPEIHVSESLVAYIQRLVQCSRESAEFPHGLSPRASIAILRASQAWALLEDRDHVLPDDVQIILPAVVDHRLRGSEVANNGQNASQILLNEVDVIQ